MSAARRQGQTPGMDTSIDEQLRAFVRMWWLPLSVGLLSIAAGVIVLIKPGNSLKAIAVVVGIFIALDGVIALIAALRRSTESRGLTAFVGVFGLVIGVLLIRHPIQGVTAVALLVGIWLIAIGAIRFVQAFDEDHRIWRILVAAVEVIAGIVIVSTPGIGLAALAIIIGVSLIANGASLVVLGYMLHGVSREELPPHHTHHAAPA
jgi:uncharacterized membrane protein HdeD (DUF308 family)